MTATWTGAHVVITGQSVRGMLGKDAFQEADVQPDDADCEAQLSVAAARHPRVVKQVFMCDDRSPGPVLIDVPKDVGTELCTVGLEAEMNLPGYKPEMKGYAPETIQKMAAALATSRRPLIIAGHGAALSHAEKELRQLAETLNAPVATTLLGKGVFPDSHRLSLQGLGMHGTAYANRAVVECDLMLAVGARLDDRILGVPSQFCKDAVKIHIDIDAAEFGKLVRPDIRCRGDARTVLQDLLPLVKRGDTAEWLERIAGFKKKWPMTYPKKGGLHTTRYIYA